MSLTFNPTITAAGEAAAINASATGVQLAISAVAFGTGSYAPNGTETSLVTEVARVPIVSGVLVAPNQARISAVWSSDTDNYPVREVGFYAGSVLFAVWSRSSGVPLGYKTPGVDFVLFNDLKFTSIPTDSITFVIDEGAGGAAMAAIASHEGAPDPHPGYVRESRYPDATALNWCGLAAGTANAIALSTIEPTVDVVSYKAGQCFAFKAAFSNTGQVTVNVEGLGAKNLLKVGAPMSSGDIAAGELVEIRYDGADFHRVGVDPSAAGRALAFAIALG